MGDRSYTEIVVNIAFRDLVDLLIASVPENIESHEEEHRCIYFQDQADHGDVPWLETLLEENFIPYDKSWGEGCNYGAGKKYVRVRCDGESGEPRLEVKETLDSDAVLSAVELKAHIEQEDMEGLVARVTEAVELSAPLEPELQYLKPGAFHDCLEKTLRRMNKDSSAQEQAVTE